MKLKEYLNHLDGKVVSFPEIIIEKDAIEFLIRLYAPYADEESDEFFDRLKGKLLSQERCIKLPIKQNGFVIDQYIIGEVFDPQVEEWYYVPLFALAKDDVWFDKNRKRSSGNGSYNRGSNYRR